MPKEAYAEFAKSGERGAAAHKAWDALAAQYKEKYPEDWAEFESIAYGKLPANWAEKLPKFTSEGGFVGRMGGWGGWEVAAAGSMQFIPVPHLLPPFTPDLLPSAPPSTALLQTRAWPPACTARPC